VRFVLCGPARDPGLAAAAQGRLQGLPWAGHLGEVAHAAMPAILRAADVALNTSRSEGLANAVLEAMACGRAVLASDIAGNRAAIRDGVDGLLYRGDEGFLAQAGRLLADPALRRRLGENARRAAARRFPPEAEAAAHDRLYRRLLAGRGPVGAAR
jgi:glycosyltransferase involved in cell wall biosynthesis